MSLSVNDAKNEDRQYWSRKFSAGVFPVSVPHDRTPVSVEVNQYDEFETQVDSGLLDELDAITNESPFLSYVVLTSAVAMVLFKYTNQHAITLGSPSYNPKVSGDIADGMVPVAIDLSSSQSLQEILVAVRDSLAEAYSHQSYPYAQILQDHSGEHAGTDVIFNVLIASAAIHQTTTMTGHDEVIVTLSDRNRLKISYRKDIFEPATITRFSGHILQATDEFIRHSTKSLAEADVMTLQEREQLLFGNVFTKKYPLSSAMDLIELQAQVNPHKIALICEGNEICYSDLNLRANIIAHELQLNHFGKGDMVPIYIERGISYITTVLAVLKIGAAFIPLDEKLPEARLVAILRTTLARGVLTSQSLTHKLDNLIQGMSLGTPPIKINVDLIHADHLNERNNLGVASVGDELAYVIFTSGSTGTPKGAMVDMGGVMNHLFAMVDHLNMEDSDLMAQTAPQSFDISVWQFLAPLTQGATVHVFPDSVSTDPFELFNQVDRTGVTILQVVPSIVQAFLDEIDKGMTGSPPLGKLRWLSTTGEALAPDLVRRWFEYFPHIPILNAYGPTECSDDVTVQPIFRAFDPGVSRVPIGRCIPNMEVYILDDRLQLVPMGGIGEICVAGVGVGRGYLNDGFRTNEAFVKTDIGHGELRRLYTTGDVGRLLSNGTIEYLGRVDDQVKIRGFRVELGEIEHQLTRLESIKDAVVVLREDVGPSAQLVAYLVASSNERPTTTEIGEQLGSCLPRVMVPTLFVWMEQFPLSRNGKVDRKSLPKPTGYRVGFVAPYGEVEVELARIWSQVLGVPVVGRMDNFFELGGDSILGIKVVYLARQAGYELRLSQIMQHHTIAELASSIVDSKSQNPMVVDAQQDEVLGFSELTPVQEWFFGEQFASPNHWNQSMYLWAKRRISPKLLRSAIGYVMLHHDELRVRFDTDGSRVIQQVVPWNPDEIPLSIYTVAAMSPAEQQDYINDVGAELHKSLDLVEGPVIRFGLMETTDDSKLLIVVHHLAIDRISWRILLDDLEEAYLLLESGQEPKLPRKTSSYKQWAEMLFRLAASGDVDDELPYWSDASRHECKAIPCDSNGYNSVESAETYLVSLSPAETKALLEHASTVLDASVHEMLVSAFVKSLSEFTHSDLVLINMETHGRFDFFAQTDPTRTVGWFTSEYPFLASVRDAREETNLRLIRQQLQAVPKQGFNYGLLRYLHPDSEVQELLRQMPKPEVSFNYLGQVDRGSSFRLFEVIPEPEASKRALSNSRTYKIDVNAAVANGRLQIAWEYSRNLHRGETIKGLANDFLGRLRNFVSIVRELTPSQIPVTHMQQWFLTQRFAEPHHWNTAMMFSSLERLDSIALRNASLQVAERHDSLRFSFFESEDGWSQSDMGSAALSPFELHDLSSLELEKRNLEVNNLVHRIQSGMSLSSGGLLRIVLIEMGQNEPQRVLVVAHHLIIDHFSWQILLDDLEESYRLCQTGQVIVPSGSGSYRQWANRLFEFAQTIEPTTVSEWTEQFGETVSLPHDFVSKLPNLESSSAQVIVALPSDVTTKALQLAQQSREVFFADLLHTALAIAISWWTKSPSVLIHQGFHGRPDLFDDIDISRTVGWFSTSIPTLLTVPPDKSLWDTVLENKKRLKVARELGFVALVATHLRVGSRVGKSLQCVPEPLISFDYDGQKVITPPSWLVAAPESRGRVRSPHAIRPVEIDITAWVHSSQLEMQWKYSTNLHKEETIHHLVSSYLNALTQIVESAEDTQ